MNGDSFMSAEDIHALILRARATLEPQDGNHRDSKNDGIICALLAIQGTLEWIEDKLGDIRDRGTDL